MSADQASQDEEASPDMAAAATAGVAGEEGTSPTQPAPTTAQ